VHDYLEAHLLFQSSLWQDGTGGSLWGGIPQVGLWQSTGPLDRAGLGEASYLFSTLRVVDESFCISRPHSPFVQSYRLDASEFEGALESFGSFNDFFSRRLRPGARPIDPSSESVVFPADGRHLGFQDLSKVDRVFAKGQSFDLKTLFQDESLADRFHQGAAVFSRLCPVDYHRFHFATSGCPEAPRLINGPLFSVNPMALRQQLAYLWQNKRMLTRLRSERLGEVLILEIGATNVGSIIQTHQPNQEVSKGDEKGYFRFGGSATMTFFEPGRVVLAHDLLNHTAQGIELYAPMGDVMGQMR